MRVLNLHRVLLPVVMALSASWAAAQTTRLEVSPGPFIGVSVSGDFELSLTSGDTYALTMDVSGEFAEFVTSEVVDSVLVIRVNDRQELSDLWKSFRGKNAPVPVFRASVSSPAVLKSVSISGNCHLKALDAVCDSAGVRFNVKDNASVGTVSVSASRAELDLSRKSSGEFRLECDTVRVSAGGSTDYTLRCKAASQVEMDLSSNASLVFAGESEHISVSARGTSRAILNGSAPYAVYNLSGSANVNALNIKVKEANIKMSGICSLMQGASDWIFLNLSNGATLTYSGAPQIHIGNIKNSSVQRYEAGRR